MTALAIIALVLLGIYIIFGSLRQHKLLINKFVVVVAVLAIGVLILQGSFSSNDSQQTKTPQLQKVAPSVQQAPYVLQTSSRAYYVATYQDTENVVILTSFYYYDKKVWELSNIPLPLDRSIYGNIKIIKRSIGG